MKKMFLFTSHFGKIQSDVRLLYLQCDKENSNNIYNLGIFFPTYMYYYFNYNNVHIYVSKNSQFMILVIFIINFKKDCEFIILQLKISGPLVIFQNIFLDYCVSSFQGLHTFDVFFFFLIYFRC